MTVSKYYTVKQFAVAHPAFKENSLRDQIFHEKENGLQESRAIVRNGRRVLIHAERYFAWMEAASEARIAAG